MTSLKVALPDSSDPCQPYYIWVAGFVSNGQRGPYSKRRRVEVCSRADGLTYIYDTVLENFVSVSLMILCHVLWLNVYSDPLERSNLIQ